MPIDDREMLPIPDTMPGPGLMVMQEEIDNKHHNDYIGHGTAEDMASTAMTPEKSS